MMNRKDIILNRNNEVIQYLFWGVISSLLNVGIFYLLNSIGYDYKISNAVTLIFIKVFSYITNKIFVFKSKCSSTMGLIGEFIIFMFARIVTFLMDYFGVILLFEILGWSLILSKISMTLLVIISNYVLSKLIVFKKDWRGVKYDK